jgi:hypothetical protein
MALTPMRSANAQRKSAPKGALGFRSGKIRKRV